MLASKPRGDTSLRLWFAFRHKCCRVAAVGLCLLGAAGTAGAQEDRSGFYVGLEVGVANASTVTSRRSGVTHPSRCDRLLYPSFLVPASIAADPACLNNTPGSSVRVNEFETGGGFAGGLSVGYMAGTLRFEVEYLNRYHGSDRAAVSATSNAVQQNKNTEWSSEEPPYEEIRSYNAHQFFTNAYYDFVNDSRWTPYAGAGIGWARTNLDYWSMFVRKPEVEYLQIAFDPDWPDEAKQAAAGTVSFIDMPVRQNVFGVQLMTGIDYALTDRASVGVKARWATFGSLSKEAAFNLVRSHIPVQADGVDPFTSTFEFDGLAYYTVTVNLKCRL